MRLILAMCLLASCAEPSPAPANLSTAEAPLADMTYLCSITGEEAIQIVYPDGSVEVRANGRSCDYEQWQADVAANGPIYSRGRPNYREWLARRYPEA